jgi:hypothetical protein
MSYYNRLRAFQSSDHRFFNKTPAMVCSEEKENKIKSFAKFRLANTGYLVSATLIYSKDFLASEVHFISFLFLSIL